MSVVSPAPMRTVIPMRFDGDTYVFDSYPSFPPLWCTYPLPLPFRDPPQAPGSPPAAVGGGKRVGWVFPRAARFKRNVSGALAGAWVEISIPRGFGMSRTLVKSCP